MKSSCDHSLCADRIGVSNRSAPSILSMAAAFSLFFLVPTNVAADDFGYFGAVFPVIEPSLLDTIFARLNEMDENGEIDEMRDEMQATTRSYAVRPPPVAAIGTSQEYRMYEVDLSIIVSQDIADHRGVVFAQAGTRVNPLDHSRFSRVAQLPQHDYRRNPTEQGA